MLRKIKLYGKLAKFVGHRILEADVATAAEAVRFLVTNWPDLERHMADQHYRVSVGAYDLDLEELHDPAGQQEIKIVPVMAGAGAVGRILIGIALVAASFIPGVGALAVSLMFGVGASLVLGGVAELLTPTPGANLDDKDPKIESYSFSGIQNSSRPGLPIPVIYGETVVGSITVSAGVSIEAI